MFDLPPLPYTYNALEPYIDARTMEIHYTKHHKGYVDNLNKAISKHPELGSKTVRELLMNLSAIPDDIRQTVRNNGGGHENHSMFWKLMSPKGGGVPQGKIATEINKYFGSFEKFKEQFIEASKSRFGSGWTWLSLTPDGKLVISSTANQDNPLSEGLVPILGLDVWEHAYYLKYQSNRSDYINAWWNIINWDQVELNYKIARAN
jgi:superoxide dismutase, Fe-Mn family